MLRPKAPHNEPMPSRKDTGSDSTSSGLKVPRRKRSAVLRDFEKVAGPLRGHNRDPKPKA